MRKQSRVKYSTFENKRVEIQEHGKVVAERVIDWGEVMNRVFNCAGIFGRNIKF